MKKINFNDLVSKDKAPYIIGGVLAGALGLWVIGKVTGPLFSPYIKDACRSYLGEDSARSARQNQPVVVEMSRIKRGKITRRIDTVGQLRANNEVTLRSEMAGRINEIKFNEGEHVDKDAILIQFEDADLRAELEAARAELTLRDADHQRLTQLREKRIESVKKYDETKAAFEGAKARVDKAQAALDKATIKAPFEGTIGLIDIDPGAFVQAAQDLVKLVDNTPIYADFKVPEKYLHDISVGQLAEVKVDAFPDQKFVATVEAIDSSVDGQSHSIALRATIPNDDGRLRSGLYANVSLIIGDKPDALLIPESALIRDGNKEMVYVVHEGKAHPINVLTGTRENGMVEVLTNLKEDLNVVTAGQIKLVPGRAVMTQGPKPEDALKALASGLEKAKKEAKKTTSEDKTKTDQKPVGKETSQDEKSSDVKDSEAKDKKEVTTSEDKTKTDNKKEEK